MIANVHVYPNAAHNPTTTAICITKDGSSKLYEIKKN